MQNSSSITKKITVALAGLFLSVFLCVHLSINLLMLKNDGGQAFTIAANFMSSNIIIKIFEILLFGSLFLHIIYSVIVTIINKKSRPIQYVINNRSETSFMSKYMFHTGVLIFVFLLLHFVNFYFVKLGIVSPPEGFDKHDFYNMAILLFTNKYYSLIYIVFLIFMGFHLNHSLHSALQTLGLNNDRYHKILRTFSTVYSIIISIGFISIPIYFLFFFR